MKSSPASSVFFERARERVFDGPVGKEGSGVREWKWLQTKCLVICSCLVASECKNTVALVAVCVDKKRLPSLGAAGCAKDGTEASPTERKFVAAKKSFCWILWVCFLEKQK